MKQTNSSQRSKESDLKKYFDKIREENYDDTFSETGKWLNSINETQLNKNSERRFILMKKYFSKHKLKLAYSFLILAFLIAACNYPVTQEEAIGDVLTWSVDKENKDAVNQIENLNWVKKGQFNINEKSANGKSVIEYSVVISGSEMDNAKIYQKQIENIPGILTVNVTPLNEPVKRPVYSAALNEIFKVDINATNLSDKELEQEILKQLKQLNAGIDNISYDFKKDANGNRIINLKIPDDGQKRNGGFDMTIKDGNNVERLKEVRKSGGDADRFKGKSDQEIREMVKEDFKEADLKDDQIEITRAGDKVMIKINKADGSNKGKLDIEDIVK